MWSRKKREPQCEFGQYEKIWGSHRSNCSRIIRITADYIVLVDGNNNIDWETTDAYEAARSPDDKKNVEKKLSQ